MSGRSSLKASAEQQAALQELAGFAVWGEADRTPALIMLSKRDAAGSAARSSVTSRAVAFAADVIADGTPEAAQRLERVLWDDPASGVMRQADAGYPEALECARRHGLDLPGVLG
jgi:hypothetical protein